MTKTKSGFTIVELLIVIVVIGILAAITIVAYNGVQQRARDTIRKSDLVALEKALEINYINHGAFTQPESICSDTSFGANGTCGATTGDGDWDGNSNMRDLIADGIINKLPIDPINNSIYQYTYEVYNAGQAGATSAGQGYDLCATLESGGNYCINKRK